MTITEIQNQFEELAQQNAALKTRLDDYENRVMVARTEADERDEEPEVKGWDTAEADGSETRGTIEERFNAAFERCQKDPIETHVYLSVLETLGYQIIAPAPAPASSQETAAILASLPPANTEGEVV